MKLARLIAEHPKTVLLICAALIVPCVFGYLGTAVNYDILTYLPDDVESVQGEKVLDVTFHNAASSIVIVENAPAKDTVKLKQQIAGVEGVSAVLWIDDIADITIPESMLPDAATDIFYSEDGNATLMMVQYENGGASETTMNAIKTIRRLLTKNMFLSGVSAITTDTKDLADSQAPIYISIAIAIALFILSFTVTSWIMPFILLAALGAAVVYNMGTNFVFGEISYITQCIAAILQLGVTMDYSVFLLDRFEEEKLRYPDKTEAMAHAIKGSFMSLVGSSATTVFGFLALCFMTFTLGLDIGLVMAKGVVLGVVTVLTLLPALILILDKPITKTKHRSLLFSFNRINEFTLKHSRLLAALFIPILLISLYGRNNVDVYYNISLAMPQDLPSISALNRMKEEFNMTTTHFVIVDENMDAGDMSEMTNRMEKVDGITNVISLSSFVGPSIPLSVLPDSIKNICIKDGKQLMMLNTSYAAATPEEIAQLDELNSIVKTYDKNGVITGEGALTKDLIDITDIDFKVTSIISIAAIFLLIAIVFKSISVPLILVASIELAIMINLAISYFTGTTIPFIGPTIIGCVQLGATVDYAILITTRFREELRKGLSKKDAMRIAANESDRSICQSALVFFGATFGVYLICDISIIRSLCLLLARGSVISAFVIVFILTPILYLLEGTINKTTSGWRVKKTKRVTKRANDSAETKCN